MDLQRFAGQKCTGADCAGLRACVFWPGFAGADFTIFMQQAVACHPEDQAISAVVQLAYERGRQGGVRRKQRIAQTANKIHHGLSLTLVLSCLLLPPAFVSWICCRAAARSFVKRARLAAGRSGETRDERQDGTHKPRAIRGETQRTKTDEEPGEVGAPRRRGEISP